MKILTALQNPEINKILKEQTNYNVVENDIQYQEGIIEILEKNNKINLIIISELLPGNIGIKETINKIKELISIFQQYRPIDFQENSYANVRYYS